MKFAEHLAAHITPEWRKQYIQYEEMKAQLYAAVEQSPSAELVDPEVLTRYFAKFDEQFFHYCDSELAKINTFYSEKLAEATRKFANLRTELSETLEMEESTKMKKKDNLHKMKKNLLRKKNVSVRKIQELKLAFSEFYLSLILLQNYQNLNFTGFRKILKKHDKLLNVDFGARWRAEHVESAHFYVNKDIDRLIHETENIVTNEIEGGDRQRAMKRLRVPPLGEQQSPWTTFKVGLFSGSLIVLCVAVVLSAMFRLRRDDWIVAFRLFRGPLLIVEFMFLWGINVYGWRSSGVNHVLIFELDPRNHLSEQHIMELASIFGVIWTMSVLGYLYADALAIPAYLSPLILYLLMAGFLLNPTKTFRHEARFWTLRILSRIVLAPFFYVNFADFWLADQLNSIVPAFLDLQYFLCFFSTISNWSYAEDPNQCINNSLWIRPVVAMLPAWFRMAQCLRRFRDTRDAHPHLANALKYSTSFFVVIFSSITQATRDQYAKSSDNPWFYLWILASIVSSCYAYTWDIKMDWGLFDSKSSDNKFLRDEVVYSSNWFYYFAIVEDLILRFGWTLSMSLIEMGYIDREIIVSILSPLEVFRRFIWNYFRLENEHLNNCGNFRAVRDISVAPMDCSDQTTILRMMDEEDGVRNRRTVKKLANKKKSEQRLLLREAESTEDLEISDSSKRQVQWEI
ncbi:xenotropic and polytropic retrovirus receptor 1 isoform X1 [Anopheles arabiensis]|uniref:SPX domain-containing protein n=1 Tax=Anopheles coluzzii TaxID=1518534 RepID=A0A6E8VNK6_ANOCL|nr:xenotropic and polytropic retrovirus receptor 1 isoform X1 [Anopheles arabiensis]XP_040228926.2 xenotropic and polytropic retrovirus receptor 1 isoform X1 [Anopheles coluzzii]XP_061505443.1 solute carrier family 53 member 1 isoform X1 [Anopheles gambiae]